MKAPKTRSVYQNSKDLFSKLTKKNVELKMKNRKLYKKCVWLEKESRNLYKKSVRLEKENRKLTIELEHLNVRLEMLEKRINENEEKPAKMKLLNTVKSPIVAALK